MLGVRIGTLEELQFPNGKMWWEWRASDKRTAVMIHCNWAKSVKKARLRRDNLWFLDDADAGCSPGFDPLEFGCDRGCIPVSTCPFHAPCSIKTTCKDLGRDASRRVHGSRGNRTSVWHLMAHVWLRCAHTNGLSGACAC